jgi:hypothetical protein
MSLVICSNNKDEVNLYDRNSLDQAPYRFRNHLTNPVVLPPNSEVAVQSVKINKDDLIQTSPTDIWFQFFGERLDTSADPTSVERSTSQPVMCSLLDLNRETNPMYLNIGEFVERLTDGMQRGMPHPDINMTTTKAEAKSTGGHTGAEFNSFDMTYAMRSSSDNGDYDPSDPTAIGFASDNWKYLTDALSLGRTMNVETNPANDGKMEVECLTDSTVGGDNNNVCWLNTNPLSHLGGVLEVDITGLQVGSGSNPESINTAFAIGLSRGTGNDFGQVGYLNRTAGDLSDNPHFYDFVVYGEQLVPGGDFFLRVGHSVVDAISTTPSQPLAMEEIIYYDDGDGSSFSAQTEWRAGVLVQSGTRGYNLSTNWGKFDRVRFTLDGEEVIVELVSSVGGAGGNVVADTDYILTGYQDAISNAGDSINYPKPAGQTCWSLYPKVMINTDGRTMTIDKYDGRQMTYQGVVRDADNSDTSWYVRMVKEGTIRSALELDTRYMYDMTDADNDYIPVPADSGNDFYENYNYVVILGNGEPHYVDTSRANMQGRLGHSKSVLHGSPGTTQTYTSDGLPDLMDRSSMFVRLDNFTQISYNSGTGRPSKMLYQVPRFDSSNRETGTALYYEAMQKTYIKLNNSDEIALNELQLSLCDSQERLADRGLTGKTIICLHFRQSTTPLFKTKV